MTNQDIAAALLALALSFSTTACGGSQSGGAEGATAGEASTLLAVGTTAPEFMLEDQTGHIRELREYRGHPVVLYFYPRDGTPGCTAEACAFRDAWDRLAASGAVVLGVSTDDVESHQRFHDENQLPFELLADEDGRVTRLYGVPMRMGMASRVTFLIDAAGVIQKVFEDVDPGIHADEVIAAIEALPPPAAASPAAAL
jgi:peroxiredoxin Q/BCP